MSPKRTPNLSLLRGVTFGNRGDYQTWMLAASGICLILIAAYSLFNVVEEVIMEDQERRIEHVDLPDFASIGDVRARKQAFFDFLEPFVAEANREILQERAEVLKLQQYFERHQKLSGSRLEALNDYLERYKLEPVETASKRTFERLLLRVDTIPVSLALAQAAIESGWGTSRFARQGNNLFGMWCYDPGCGIVPKRRPAGRTYEVAAYESPRQSFYAYLTNLNTNDSYAALREIRAAFRDASREPSGHDLAEGLVRYSQERWEYVGKVRRMISQNNLDSRT
ncbi:glucosaminidase domain-containing protein [Pelagicoccus sp. SDUM812003]|uniref:glucosaminidase domain-containing protein n=1 Tax=Pelagicoccus sp. SDUM812003 TaxID=3041267 RepID=UPI00280CF7A7|nr:glucosaminidase domain-containing protein [Pelagicoccus sp. SDUM812003]MDQ8205342.1 glucosaminidase domain-containing protein [Pelagicoccus sp. SDUM812003]